MQTFFSAISATVICLLFPAFADSPSSNKCALNLAELEATYHVRIHCQPDLSISFPRNWMEPALQLEAVPIHTQDVQTLLPALEQFLHSHPAAVIEQNLENIYLLGKLRIRGQDYGGTHTGKSMYIVWDQSRKNTPEFILERFHSEFSSILREHHAFPNGQWETINPGGFSYSGTGFEMLGTGSIYVPNELDQENGFLMRYSMSSLENDFNMISAWLFTRPDDLDAVSMQHERIQRKKALAEEFYLSLSNQYVFRQSGLVPSL